MDQRPAEKRPEQKLKGAMLTFIVLQLIYLFYFFSSFPDSFSNALNAHNNLLLAVAGWLSTVTMLGYCIVCLFAVAQLVMKKHGFLLWFQIAGAIALIGNFLVFVLRQVAEATSSVGYYYANGNYYWVLFIMALFWTVIWCMYFARSSRVFSYMGEDATYLRMALFTKNVVEPAPWEEPKAAYAFRQPVAPPAPPPAPQPGYQAPPAPGQPQGGAYTAPYPPVGGQPNSAEQPPQAYPPPPPYPPQGG